MIHRRLTTLLLLLTTSVFPVTACAHLFIVGQDRVGPTPDTEGTGWLGEVFLDIPDAWATQLLTVEAYIADRQPDFTFRTTYIDFPAGPGDSMPDSQLVSLGDFLDDYIFDVSDPAMLDAFAGNFVIRFTGLVDVDMAHSTSGDPDLPVLLDFATQGFGAYRVRIGATSIYRILDTAAVNDPFFTENGQVLALGLFPVQVTYFNRYDPDAEVGHELAGIELYSWHGGGLPWPAGEILFLPGFGHMTVTPPRVIYQPADIPVPTRGDADQDRTIDLFDYAVFQRCLGDESLNAACMHMDFDSDQDVDADDYMYFHGALAGPIEYPFAKADYDANQHIDLRDYQWLQTCFSTGGGEEDFRQGLDDDCRVFDFDENNLVDLTDFGYFFGVIHGPSGM